MLERYAELCGDAAAFAEACARPLPKVVWANPLRGDPAETGAALLRRCPDARPVPWHPAAWRIPPGATPGHWPEFWEGRLHVQEEAALWAVPLLDLAPGQSVLDACAAPGNKTAQIAAALGDVGNLWAADRSPGRVAVMRRTLERLGVTCAAALCADLTAPPGVRNGLPDGPAFDRALADVPCSCEGTSRKLDGRREAVSEGERAFLAGIQRRILRRVLARVRPGGVVVYATCTYAPEENEAVLDAALGELACVEPCAPPPGLTVRPGVTAFAGRSFRADVANALRLWPQDNDTGGFFVARLRRL